MLGNNRRNRTQNRDSDQSCDAEIIPTPGITDKPRTVSVKNIKLNKKHHLREIRHATSLYTEKKMVLRLIGHMCAQVQE